MNTWRENTIWTIQAIAWQSAFDDLRRAMRSNDEDVKGELMCMWCDDLYHPELDQFREQFSDSELSEMETFDRRMNEAKRPWESLPEWITIQDSARQLIQICGWNEPAAFNGRK